MRFPGQYYDEETGLHYNYHRYYSHKLGRYITPDPIGLAGGLNLYHYVLSSPLAFIDPFGLEIWVTIRKARPSLLRMFNANHLYLWDTTANAGTGEGYGMAGSSGSGVHEREEKPLPGKYIIVPGSVGREKEIMHYMRQIADEGAWIPGMNDCFTKVEEGLEHFNLKVDIPWDRTGPIQDVSPGYALGLSKIKKDSNAQNCGK